MPRHGLRRHGARYECASSPGCPRHVMVWSQWSPRLRPCGTVPRPSRARYGIRETNAHSAPILAIMTPSDSTRDRLTRSWPGPRFHARTVRVRRAPGGARFRACQWVLGLRFPEEDLTGLTAPTRDALMAARAVAFWRDHQLIGLTSGHRDPAEQRSLFADEVGRVGSLCAARTRVLPADESAHVIGIAVDVRPPKARNGSRSKARNTACTASTATNGGTSSTGRASPSCCRIPVPGSRSFRGDQQARRAARRGPS